MVGFGCRLGVDRICEERAGVVLCGGFAVESRSRSIVKMTCETAKIMQRAQNMVSIVPASFVNFFSLHSRTMKFWVERRELRTFELGHPECTIGANIVKRAYR